MHCLKKSTVVPTIQLLITRVLDELSASVGEENYLTKYDFNKHYEQFTFTIKINICYITVNLTLTKLQTYRRLQCRSPQFLSVQTTEIRRD